jgi:hypothetical protein
MRTRECVFGMEEKMLRTCVGVLQKRGGKKPKKKNEEKMLRTCVACIAEEGKKETKNEKRREDAENVCVYRRRAKKIKKRKE